jgi:hypothetical protein
MCGEPRALDTCGECGRRVEHSHAEGGGEPRALGTLDRGIACVSGDLRDATLAWSMGGFRHASVGMGGLRGASVSRHERGSWRGVEGAGAAPAKGGAYARCWGCGEGGESRRLRCDRAACATYARPRETGIWRWNLETAWRWNLEMESEGGVSSQRCGSLPFPATTLQPATLGRDCDWPAKYCWEGREAGPWPHASAHHGACHWPVAALVASRREYAERRVGGRAAIPSLQPPSSPVGGGQSRL